MQLEQRRSAVTRTHYPMRRPRKTSSKLNHDATTPPSKPKRFSRFRLSPSQNASIHTTSQPNLGFYALHDEDLNASHHSTITEKNSRHTHMTK